jgi:hypothetical protein
MNTPERISGPDVLHIGFSKCASTFLQAFFQGHPDVFLVNQSHYLAPFELSEYPDRKDEYLERFSGAMTTQVRLESDEHIVLPLFHPVLGAAATTLESVEEVSQRIKSIAPDAKIVIVIRNQCGMLVSRYSEFVICGGTKTFDEFVSEFLNCSVDGENYFQNYYAQILQVFENDFSTHNVLLLLQENLRGNEEATIRQLSEFLGIEERRPYSRGVISRRVGLSKLGIKVVRALNRVLVKKPKQSYHEAEVRIPFLLYKIILRVIRLTDYYLPKVIKGDKDAILTDELRQRIKDEFADDNAVLAERLGVDLSRLG